MSKEKENRGIIRYNSGEYSNYVDLNNTRITEKNIPAPGKGINFIPSNQDSYGYSVSKKGNKKGEKNETIRIFIPKGEGRRMAKIPKKTIAEKLIEIHPKLTRIRY